MSCPILALLVQQWLLIYLLCVHEMISDILCYQVESCDETRFAGDVSFVPQKPRNSRWLIFISIV